MTKSTVHAIPLLPGFADPVLDSQYTFRQVLNAMAHPARLIPLEIKMEVPVPLYRSTGAICLMLLDYETPLWVDLEGREEVKGWLRFHCGCPITPFPSSARFALLFTEKDLPFLSQFHSGEDEFPEQSATLIIQVGGFTAGIGRSFRGPGVETVNRLTIHGLSDRFWKFWEWNHRQYPRGVDVLFTSESTIVGLPRTIEVME